MDGDLVISTVVAGAVGLLLGYLIRLTEVIRSERKVTYVAYLRALDRLPHALMEAAILQSAEVPAELVEEAARSIAEAEADMSLTASRRVLRKTAALRAVLNGPGLIQLAAATLRGTADMEADSREAAHLSFMHGYWSLTASPRTDVVNAMRTDLRVRKLEEDVATVSTWA